VIAHELMHLIQYSQWITADAWLLEGTAEWAGFNVSGYSPFGGSILDTVGAPDMSLDCDSDACGNDYYETGGYSRWPFFEYLSDRFGIGVVKDVFARGAALADPAQTGATLLDSTLVTKGTTLSTVFGDYALAGPDGRRRRPGPHRPSPRDVRNGLDRRSVGRTSPFRRSRSTTWQPAT
jgi:hypothetical protein